MEDLLLFLKSIELRYMRTIFNFHIKQSLATEIDIYNVMKEKIYNNTVFDDVVIEDNIKSIIKKFIYCDINITKHIINHAAYTDKIYDTTKRTKSSRYFDITLNSEDSLSVRTRDIFLNDRSSLVSYVKTARKKNKIDYGEIKKTIHCAANTGYYSGCRSDDYLSTTVITDKTRPWIKSVSKRLRVDIIHHSIVTRGKSSILQTIEIIYTNRTCIKIFKDSTLHIILSKDKAESCCLDLINKLFDTYYNLFSLLYNITGNILFDESSKIAFNVLTVSDFMEKVNIIRKNRSVYGIYNFSIGMFNLTYTQPIYFTIIPSLIEHNSKIKFFKGKKLNIVALSSLQECEHYVACADKMLEMMKYRSDVLDTIDILTESIDKIKELLI